jgi:hypothetical protein
MGAAGQIFGQNLDGVYQNGPIKGSPYNAPSLLPSLKNFNFTLFHKHLVKNNYLCTYDFYSPVHNVWLRAYPLRGEVEGGWALEFKSFLGPVK